MLLAVKRITVNFITILWQTQRTTAGLTQSRKSTWSSLSRRGCHRPQIPSFARVWSWVTRLRRGRSIQIRIISTIRRQATLFKLTLYAWTEYSRKNIKSLSQKQCHLSLRNDPMPTSGLCNLTSQITAPVKRTCPRALNPQVGAKSVFQLALMSTLTSALRLISEPGNFQTCSRSRQYQISWFWKARDLKKSVSLKPKSSFKANLT